MRPKKGAKGKKHSTDRNTGFYYNPTWIERQVAQISRTKG